LRLTRIKPLVEARARARRLLGIETLQKRVARLEGQLRALEPGGWERSRERWRNVQPDVGLTWGQSVSGDAFIAKVAEGGGFGPQVSILEIGPGYGRLPEAMLRREAEFEHYTGVDISTANVAHLHQRFGDPRLEFMVADAEQMTLPRPCHLLVSSLVFKHLYPSFEPVLTNAAGQLAPGALVYFDLIEGAHRVFEADGVTYIRCYTREEVGEIIPRTGLEMVGLDTVRHDEAHPRLLVVARRPSSA
jgi:SAM-dependent methyltransferase